MGHVSTRWRPARGKSACAGGLHGPRQHAVEACKGHTLGACNKWLLAHVRVTWATGLPSSYPTAPTHTTPHDRSPTHPHNWWAAGCKARGSLTCPDIVMQQNALTCHITVHPTTLPRTGAPGHAQPDGQHAATAVPTLCLRPPHHPCQACVTPALQLRYSQLLTAHNSLLPPQPAPGAPANRAAASWASTGFRSEPPSALPPSSCPCSQSHTTSGPMHGCPWKGAPRDCAEAAALSSSLPS
jgi:hypothetical protein